MKYSLLLTLALMLSFVFTQPVEARILIQPDKGWIQLNIKPKRGKLVKKITIKAANKMFRVGDKAILKGKLKECRKKYGKCRASKIQRVSGRGYKQVHRVFLRTKARKISITITHTLKRFAKGTKGTLRAVWMTR